MEDIHFQQMVEHGIHKLVYFLDIEHHIHSIYEKNIIERTIQYIKDRTESFDDYFPSRKEMNCKLEYFIFVKSVYEYA
jgi:hypothetical protein